MSWELRLGNSIELETLIEFEMEQQQQQRDELFRILFAVVRDDHPENVFTSMENIMYVLLDESEDITEEFLLILLSTLGRRSIQGVSVSEAARKLAMNVIDSRAAKLEPLVKQFLVSSMSEDGPSNCRIDYHRLIYDLYRYSPQILSGLIPYITGELLNDQSEARIRTVNLVGELFAIPGSVIHEAFQPIFVEFLKRLTDTDVEVRMTVLDFVKKSLRSNPSKPKAAQIFAALCDRLLDYDENVRKQVVAVICNVACFNPGSVPVETTKLVAERLHDKFVSLETLAVKVSANLSHPSESGEFQYVMNGSCKQDGYPMCKDLIRNSSISKGGEEEQVDEDKKESIDASEHEHADEGNMKEVHTDDANTEESTQKNKYEQSKPELDDWEDAADISTPKLESSGEGVHDEEVFTKKYSRDFLLTFSELCPNLPEGFEIVSDVADALMCVHDEEVFTKKYSRDFLLIFSQLCPNLPEGFEIMSDVADALMRVSTPRSDREYPTAGRVVDRAGVGTRDRRGNVTMNAERWWNKQPGPFSPDPMADFVYGNDMSGFQGGRGPGPNYGVLRNPIPQGPIQNVGGILSGPMHSLGFQGVQRNNSDTDRWLRGTNFNKRLMPSHHSLSGSASDAMGCHIEDLENKSLVEKLKKLEMKKEKLKKLAMELTNEVRKHSKSEKVALIALIVSWIFFAICWMCKSSV